MSDSKKKGKDFDRMFIEAVQGNISFFAWSSVNNVIEKCELKIKAYRKEMNEFELEIKDGQQDKLPRVVPSNKMLNFYVPGISVSFTSELKEMNMNGRLKLVLPLEYTFFERRLHERVQPDKSCFVSYEYKKTFIKRSVYDISIGGVAIILPRTYIMSRNIDKDEIGTITLEIGARKFPVEVECVSSIIIDRYKLDHLPYGGFKVSFRFKKMSKEDKEFLTEYVTHQVLIQAQPKKVI